MIDLSNDFVDPGGKAARAGGRDVAPAVGAVRQAAMLATGARRAGVAVIHCLHTTLPGAASDSAVWHDARSRATYSATDICLDGSWGQQPVDQLAPEPGDHVVKKFRYGAFTGTSLELLLRSLALDTVICVGVSTNVCVDTTAREAFSREFFVHIAEDACASWDMSLHDAALRTAGQRFAVVARTAAFLDSWAAVATSSETEIDNAR
nr:cysteine hydrolase [Phytoactinopolyspora alkaliphila]